MHPAHMGQYLSFNLAKSMQDTNICFAFYLLELGSKCTQHRVTGYCGVVVYCDCDKECFKLTMFSITVA